MTVRWVLLVSVLILGACEQGRNYAQVPDAQDLGSAIGEMYLRAGLADKILEARILGKHYRTSSDSWKVVACLSFSASSGGSGRDCNDSFELYQLDTGVWMVSGTVNGGYLWIELPEDL